MGKRVTVLVIILDYNLVQKKMDQKKVQICPQKGTVTKTRYFFSFEKKKKLGLVYRFFRVSVGCNWV